MDDELTGERRARDNRTMTALDDAALVRCAQAGEVTGLGVLLERHRARLHAVAVSILGHGPDAEDAVQDTFVIALRRIGELRDPAGRRRLAAHRLGQRLPCPTTASRPGASGRRAARAR